MKGEREPFGLRVIAWFANGLIKEARRQAFLEAAYVAATIRDEYEAMGQNLANGVQTRQRYNRDATVARQIKGAILARGGIQDWPAPKPNHAASGSAPVEARPTNEEK